MVSGRLPGFQGRALWPCEADQLVIATKIIFRGGRKAFFEAGKHNRLKGIVMVKYDLTERAGARLGK